MAYALLFLKKYFAQYEVPSAADQAWTIVCIARPSGSMRESPETRGPGPIPVLAGTVAFFHDPVRPGSHGAASSYKEALLGLPLPLSVLSGALSPWVPTRCDG